jgi:hypothetical protein
MAVRREIPWESNVASRTEVLRKERELIQTFRANDPTLGYNRKPRGGDRAMVPIESGLYRPWNRQTQRFNPFQVHLRYVFERISGHRID